MMWTVPNVLTMARLVAAPGVVLAFVVFDRPVADHLALWLFLSAAVTDFFDGWLARRLGQISPIGTMLDPIADKAMVVTALAALLGLYGFDWMLAVPVALILLREVLVSGIREYLGEVKLAVTVLAKWKTAAQMGAIGLLLAVEPVFAGDWVAEAIGLGLLWIAAVLTTITGWDYAAKALRYIREREEQ
ncbi:MAG: CDP-diacylglycerol--glycerol-3-phosphate 3-phosphatidyltransferase [Pseudomonadota bacterium]